MSSVRLAAKPYAGVKGATAEGRVRQPRAWLQRRKAEAVMPHRAWCAVHVLCNLIYYIAYVAGFQAGFFCIRRSKQKIKGAFVGTKGVN